jgi:hypothetical protein
MYELVPAHAVASFLFILVEFILQPVVFALVV